MLGNPYTKFVVLDIKFCFTCNESDLYSNIVMFQNIMTRIVGEIKTFAHNCVCHNDSHKQFGEALADIISTFADVILFC